MKLVQQAPRLLSIVFSYGINPRCQVSVAVAELRQVPIQSWLGPDAGQKNEPPRMAFRTAVAFWLFFFKKTVHNEQFNGFLKLETN